MSHFQQLLERTCCARQQFIEVPLIQETLRRGAPMNVYLDFLTQAYHHVKHTAPLMGLAASRCGAGERIYQSELFDYLAEERGHEEWILDDINALGGDSEAVRGGSPRFPCKIMVGHANGIQPRYLPLIIECTSDFYKLYGDIFRDIDSQHKAHAVAA
jgi:hypothetical protein